MDNEIKREMSDYRMKAAIEHLDASLYLLEGGFMPW